MSYAPQQNWSQIEPRMRLEHARWLKSLSVDDRFSILEDLHRLAGQIRGGSSEDPLVDLCRWQKKVALRNKVLDALVRLDRWIDARPLEADLG